MTDLAEALATYWTLRSGVPQFSPDDRELEAAYKRGDAETFERVMCVRLWLLVCCALAPLFKEAYGSPTVFYDADAGELCDVWEPVLRHAFKKEKAK